MDAMIRRRMMMAEVGRSPTPPATPTFYTYLVFDGTAYIVTDIIPPIDFSVETVGGHESIKAAQRFMMCSSTDGFFGFVMGSSTTSSTRRWIVFYGSSSAVVNNKGLSFTYDIYSIIFTPKRFGFGDSTSTFTKGSGTPNGYLHIGQNPTLTGQPFSGYMGIIHIYDDSAQDATTAFELRTYTPMYTLRPCMLNGEAGLWNVEEGKFYGNSAGSGQLSVTN